MKRLTSILATVTALLIDQQLITWYRCFFVNAIQDKRAFEDAMRPMTKVGLGMFWWHWNRFSSGIHTMSMRWLAGVLPFGISTIWTQLGRMSASRLSGHWLMRMHR